MLEKISSNYIFKNIFTYIKDENIIYYLIVNSKTLQKKLDLELIDYQKKCFFKLGIIHLINYFNDKYEDTHTFKQDELVTKLEKDLLKYKIDNKIIQTYASNFLRKYKKTILKEYSNKTKLNIGIYSPFFDVISTSEIFEYIFNIYIPINKIIKYNLKDDYITTFDKMNK